MPNVGKSTLFQALTKKQVDTSNYPFATIDPNVGVVSVPDERLQKLAELSKSKKIVPAIVEFVDIAGLVKGASQGEGLGNQFLTHIREVDAICHVVRAFENDNIIHVSGTPNPLSDLEIIKTELLLKDLEVVSKARIKAGSEAKTGRKEALALFQNLEILEKILNSQSDVFSCDESIKKTAENYNLLSFKPTLIVFNVSQKNNLDVSGFSHPISHTVKLDIAQENDIAAMTDEEKKELGIKSELPNLIRIAYDLLGLITFFTTGEDESRAWTILKNSTAKHAGRAIHSDFEEKFIRVDVIFWEQLLKAGSWARARDLGLLRSEGKEYIVKDGDVVEFKI